MTTPEQTPNVGLHFGWETGDDNWGGPVNWNWLLLDVVNVPFAKSITQTTPPTSPENGDRYIIPAGATGAWANKVGRIAYYASNQWLYFQPKKGWYQRVWDTRKTYVWNGTAWEYYLDSITPEMMSQINAAVAAGEDAVEAAASAAADRSAVHQDRVAVDAARQSVDTNAAQVAADKNATVSARAAAVSAANDAAVSRQNASESAVIASQRAQEAAASASAASASSQQAQDAVGEVLPAITAYTTRYYGPLASDPATRPDGTARQKGDEYFSTSLNKRKVWNGSTWEIASADAAAGDALSPVAGWENVPSSQGAGGVSDVMNQQAEKLLNRTERLREMIGISDAYSYKGEGYFDSVFSSPAAEDTPTVSMLDSSQISGASVLVPTADFYYDQYFRYDGTFGAGMLAITGGIRTDSANGQICPEIYTDAQDIEFKFNPGRTGANAVHIRVLVDGKWCQLQMLRFNSVSGTPNYYRLQFPTKKARRIKIEQEGHSDFLGAYVGTYAIAKRPDTEYRHRHVAIGDSLQQGGYYYGDVSGSYYYCRWEAHSRLQAALMGADSYINLGQGGTGWSNVVASNPFSARIPVALAAKPQSIGFYGSRNDSGRESQVLAAVISALSLVNEVPVVLVCGPQQAGYGLLNALVKQGAMASGRVWLNLDGLAASPSSNPTGHPTFTEQVALAKAAHSQIDLQRINSIIDAAYFARPAPSISIEQAPTSPIGVGSSQTYTAAVTAGFYGKVQFYLNGNPLGLPQQISIGVASIATNPPEGTNTIHARYLPDDPMTARSSFSSPVTVKVNSNFGFTDNFDRADGAIGSTVNGKAWDTTYSGWVISSNRAGRPSATSTGYTTVDSGLSNGVFAATMRGTFNKNAGLVFRYSDGSNFLRLNWLGTGDNPKLDAVVANASVGAVTGTGGAWMDGDVIEVTMNETAVSVKKNGIIIVSGTFSQGQGNSKAGFIGTAASTACYFDNASFVPLP